MTSLPRSDCESIGWCTRCKVYLQQSDPLWGRFRADHQRCTFLGRSTVQVHLSFVRNVEGRGYRPGYSPLERLAIAGRAA